MENGCLSHMFCRLLACIVAAILLVGPHAARADGPPPLVLKTSDDFYQSVRDYALHLEDATLEMGLEQVLQRGPAFSPITTPFIDFGSGSSRHWIWMVLSNQSATDGEWRIDLRIQFLKEVSVYAVRPDGAATLLLSQTGEDPFDARPIESRFLATDVAVAAGETVEIFIGFQTTGPAYLPVSVGTKEGTIADQAKEDRIDALFNGGLVVMMLISVMLVPIAGWVLSLSFLGYIIATTMYVFQADGYAFQFLWPNNPQLHDIADIIIGLSMPATGLIFSRALFDARAAFGRWDWIIAGTALVAVIMALLSPFYISNGPLVLLAHLVVLAGTLIQMITAVFALRLGLLGARPFFLGIFCVALAIGYATIAHTQPGYWNLDRTLDVGHAAVLVECFAFIGAVVARMLAIKDQRDFAMQAELKEVRQRLKTETELRATQANYARARSLSEARLDQLASVTHDIQGPIKTLRQIVSGFNTIDEADVNRIQAALDYIEDLAQWEMRSATAQFASDPAHDVETFSNRVVLANVAQLFGELAHKNGIRLRHVANDIEITVNPVRLMRILSNLIVNTIEHSKAERMLLACRLRAGNPIIEVWDDGVGIGADKLDAMRQKGQMGDGSPGAGLGLAIVDKECASEGLGFEICSRRGRGTCMRIVLQRSARAAEEALTQAAKQVDDR